MKLKRVILSQIILVIMVSGCTVSSVDIGPKREVASYSEEMIEAVQPLQVNIDVDSSSIEIYSWDKNQVKFEMTRRIRGILKKELMEKQLEDFNVSIKQYSSTISFKSKYKGSISNPIDRSVDLKIYIPKRINSIDIKMEVGRIKFIDDIKCDLNAEIDMANVDINNFEGRINFNADMGDLRIANGEIDSGSYVNLNFGNMYIKTRLVNSGEYSFETNSGNVDLLFPTDSNVNLESTGNLGTNDFLPDKNAPGVKVRSGMGKITVTKY